jgi:hypothetical protein
MTPKRRVWTVRDVKRLTVDEIRRMIGVGRVLEAADAWPHNNAGDFAARVADRLIGEEALPNLTDAWEAAYARVKAVNGGED